MPLTVNFKEEEEKKLEIKVQNGVDFLDRIVGDWYDHIDLEKLDMSHPFCCIIGQLFFSYNCGIVALDLSIEESRNMGFEVSDSLYFRIEYKQLTVQWKKVIKSIREDRNVK